jgi:hypothetical protein
MFPVKAERISGQENNFSFWTRASFYENTTVENQKATIQSLLTQKNPLIENKLHFLLTRNFNYIR